MKNQPPGAHFISPLPVSGIPPEGSRAFAKQFRKAARGGITDHLRDLSHGKIRVDQQMLRLTHPALLDIFRDRTAGQLLKG